MTSQRLRSTDEKPSSEVGEESVGPLWDPGRVQTIIHDLCKITCVPMEYSRNLLVEG